MEINLNSKHLAIIGVAFLLGGIIGYLVKGQSSDCPEVATTSVRPLPPEASSQPGRQTTTMERTSARYRSSNPQTNTRSAKKAERIFNDVADDLRLTGQQREDVLSVIDKNFPNQEYLSGNVDMSSILNTVNEIKPLLSEQQTAQLEQLVMKEVMKRGIR